jgi:hypothetical protein
MSLHNKLTKHISQDVAQEFANRSYELQHIFVHSILKENARRGLVAGFLKHDTLNKTARQKSEASDIMAIGNVDSNREEETEEEIPRDWYPFDPYVLPRSKGFVSDYFLEYSPVHAEDDEMEDDEDTEMSTDMDSDGEVDM